MSAYEIYPAGRGLKPADRTIVEIARQNNGLYVPDSHRAIDPSASDDFVQAHVRRLEALRRHNLVGRLSDGSWEIPTDFEDRIATMAGRNAQYPGRIVTLSLLSLDQQINIDGATWLDRQPVPLCGMRFVAAAAKALDQRRNHLIALGLAEHHGKMVRYQRNLLAHLRRREVLATAEHIAKQTGLSITETVNGQRIEGLYRRPIHLASGKFAVIEMSREFTLLPWRPVLERRRGKIVGGIMRGGTVSFNLGRKRGLGIG